MKNFNSFNELDTSVVDLTDKAKLSLYKKSSNSGIAVDILEEVYRRGYSIWNEQFGGTPDSFAFDRVNSFISNGFAVQLDEDLLEKRGLWDNIHAKRARIKAGSGERMRKPGSEGAPTDDAIKTSQNEDADPCWKGYKMVGMKKKGSKNVPNCVPVKEELNVKTPSVEMIAKKFSKSPAEVRAEVLKGVKVEKEHTKNTKNAAEIARDHLGERPDYYKKLKKVEKGPIKEDNITAEKRSKDFTKSSNRFIGTDELVKNYSERTPGQIVKEAVMEAKTAAWQRKEGKNPEGGLNKKGVESYRRENPGSKLQTAVTEKKPTGKRASRRKSFCARMGGMKKRLTSAKTANDPNSRINKSLRKWNC